MRPNRPNEPTMKSTADLCIGVHCTGVGAYMLAESPASDPGQSPPSLQAGRQPKGEIQKTKAGGKQQRGSSRRVRQRCGGRPDKRFCVRRRTWLALGSQGVRDSSAYSDFRMTKPYESVTVMQRPNTTPPHTSPCDNSSTTCATPPGVDGWVDYPTHPPTRQDHMGAFAIMCWCSVARPSSFALSMLFSSRSSCTSRL